MLVSSQPNSSRMVWMRWESAWFIWQPTVQMWYFPCAILVVVVMQFAPLRALFAYRVRVYLCIMKCNTQNRSCHAERSEASLCRRARPFAAPSLRSGLRLTQGDTIGPSLFVTFHHTSC